MNSFITSKSNGSVDRVADSKNVILTSPSVVTLGIGPEEVAHFNKVGNDLVLILKDGSQVVIADFFVTYEDDGRNDIVLVDENDVTWWAQYTDDWDRFHIAEIEDAVIAAPFPVGGAILGLIGAGVAAGAGGGSDRVEPIQVPRVGDPLTEDPDEDRPAEAAKLVEAGLVTGENADYDGISEFTGTVFEPTSEGGTITQVALGDTAVAPGEPLDGKYGTLTLNEDGSYTYVLNNDLDATQALVPGQLENEDFTYTFVSTDGTPTTETLSIVIEGMDDKPLISGADQGAVVEDITLTTEGMLDVSDPDAGDTHTWAIVEGQTGTYGSFTLDENGAWTYVLNNDMPEVQALGPEDQLTETMLVRVTDSYGAFSEKFVTVTITGIEDGQTLINSETSNVEAGVTEITDTLDGENTDTHSTSGQIGLTTSGVSVSFVPAEGNTTDLGTFALQEPGPDGVGWTFDVPDSVLDGLAGTTVLTQNYVVTVTGPDGSTETEIVTVTITGSNDRPEANDDSSSAVAGQTVAIDVASNDTDADTGEAGQLRITEVAGQPILPGDEITIPEGTVSLRGNSELSFTPNPGVTGDVFIPYTINDNSGAPNAENAAIWVIDVSAPADSGPTPFVGSATVQIADDTSPDMPGTPDSVLASIDDLANVPLTGDVPVGSTITSLTVTDGVNTVDVPVGSITVDPDGMFSTTADLSGLDDGTLTVTLNVNNLGNGLQARDTIVKDTVAEVLIDPVIVPEDGIPTITGTGEPSGTVDISIDGGPAVTVPVLSNGTWTFTPATPVPGPEFNVAVSTTDPFGNVATDDRDVASLTVEDQSPLGPEELLFDEAELATGTNPSAGSESISATLTVGTGDGAITEITIGGQTISVADLTNSGVVPVGPINTTYGAITVTDYVPGTGVISYDYVLNGPTDTHVNGVGIPSETDVLRETIAIEVVDNNGDTRVTSLVVGVVDDVPVVDVLPAGALSLQTSDAALGTDPTTDLSGLFDIDFGADAAAAVTPEVYALGIATPGGASGLTDMSSGDPIVLTLESGVVVGRVGGTGPDQGEIAFRVLVDPANGDVTLDQQRTIEHPDGAGANVASITDAAVQLSVVATDGDGDAVTQSTDIGALLRFMDDLPSVAATPAGAFVAPDVITQDSDALAGTDTAVANFTAALEENTDFGADGAAAADSIVWAYGLSLQGGAASAPSGLTADGDPITLYSVAGEIVGSTATSVGTISPGNTNFNILVAADGNVTLSQFTPIDHPNTADPSEAIRLDPALIRLDGTATATDADGDTDTSSTSLAIGGSFGFEDDGPTVGAEVPAPDVTDVDLRTGGATSVVTNPLNIDFGGDSNGGTLGVAFQGTQTALEALNLTSGGASLNYTVVGGLLTADDGVNDVFTVQLQQPTLGNGFQTAYTLTLIEPLDHLNGVTPIDDLTLPFALIATDSDGDTAPETFDVRVLDDVPVAVDQPALNVTEGDPTIGSSASGENLINNDTQGADGARIHQVTYTDDAGDSQTVTITPPAIGTGVLDTQYGSLTVNADGTWSYTSDASVSNPTGVPVSDDFSYTLIDGDGDISNVATQPIAVADTAPVAVDDTAQSVAESGGNLTGNVITNDTPSADGGTAVGNFTYTDVSGAPVTFTFPMGVTTQTVATPTGSLTVNTDGTWSFSPTATFDHDAPGADAGAGSFSYILVDTNGSPSNSATQPLTVTDTDPATAGPSLSLDESALPNAGSDGNVAGDPTQTQAISITKGPDDIADVIFDADTIAGLPSGLTSGGTALNYTVSGDGHTLTATAGPGGATVFVLEIGNPTDATGASQEMTATLFGPLDQTGATQTQLSVDYLVRDVDSDVSGTATFTIVDDTPLAPINDTPIVVTEGGAADGSAGAGANLLGNDTLGADAGRVFDISYTDRSGDAQTALVPTTGAVTVDTEYGELSVQADGTWSYTSIATADHVKPASDTALRDDFTYRTSDGDGDLSPASATQQITVNDTTPAIGTPVDNTVSEANLSNGSNPQAADLTVTGSLNLVPGQDTFTTTLTTTPTGLTSGGDALEFVFSNGDQTVVAYGGAGRTAADRVFSLDLTNPEAGNAGYSFTLLGKLDHDALRTLDLDFGLTMTDSDDDVVTDGFTITVTDDVPQGVINQSVAEDGNFVVNTSADATPANTTVYENGNPVTGTPSGNTMVYQLENGTVTIQEDGSALYEPSPNYNGTNSFVVETDDGTGITSTTVNVTVTPVSDAPTQVPDAANVSTPEDTVVPLGLNAPTITDDGISARNDAIPERIGAITLTGLPDGAQLQDGSGTPLFTSTGGPVTILLTDTPTVNGATGTLSMTVAEYEALQVLPPLHESDNFAVTANVSSFEVDGSGDVIVGVAGAPATPAVVDVIVKAVTDDAVLTFDETVTTGVANADQIVYSGAGGNTVAEIDLDEDTRINVRDILEASFADLDGSEDRAIEITNNTGETISVGGQNLAPGASRSFDANSQTGDVSSFPNILIGGRADYSGELNGITVTLVAQDVDADGFITSGSMVAGPADGEPEADLTNNSVTLNLNVAPIATDVATSSLDVTGSEDTAIGFLQNIRVSDTSTTNGAEVVTGVVFDVPVGWTFADSNVSNGAAWTVTTMGAEHTIAFTAGTQAEREAVLDGFTLTPPAHSSLDTTVVMSVSTADSNTFTGADSATVTRTVNIEVTPVAEEIGNGSLIDTDGDSVADLEMTPGFVYSNQISEDEWFDLNSEGFDLSAGWLNQDGDEIGVGNDNTYARLTPSVPDESAVGSIFRWMEGGNPVQQVFNGTPVDIPVSALNTVEFMLPEDVSGRVTIGIQAYTEDFDDDNEGSGTPATAVSGTAQLIGIDVLPVADKLALTLNALAPGDEDTAIPLSIRPSSSDESETFTITIGDIPVGATVNYNGTLFTASLGNTTLEIEEFDQDAPLTITPPLNSNDDFDLSIEAVSVDTTSFGGTPVTSTFSPAAMGGISVAVRGDADSAPGVSTPQVYSEADLDSGSDTIDLADLVSFSPDDGDGSEQLSVRITDLPDGFRLSAGAMVSPPSATGEDRVWALSPSEFASATVNVPNNYSGEISFSAEPVTTENDGDSAIGAPVAISFEVTPSHEAGVSNSAVLVEDVVTTLGFTVVSQNGDQDERIGAVRIPIAEAATAGYELYLGTGGSAVTLAAAGLPTESENGTDYYVLTAAEAETLSALGELHKDQSIGSFTLEYQIIDDSFGAVGAPSTSTSPFQTTTFSLTASPVTDLPDASITAISGVQGTTVVSDQIADDDANPDNVVLGGVDIVTVNLNVTSPDSDGTEHVTRVIIDNVPLGITVMGGQAISATSWLLVFDGANALPISSGAGTDVPVQFDVSDQIGVVPETQIDMTVQVQDRGNDAGAGTSVREDTVSWTLETTFGAGPQDGAPAEIILWEYNNTGVTEDVPFALSDLMNASVDTLSTRANTLTVQITDLPADADVSGMILTNINGVDTYTASVTSNDGDSDAAVQALLDALLDGIVITTPEHSNDNNNGTGGLPFSTTLITKVIGSAENDSATVTPLVPVTPVTDPATILIEVGASDADGNLDEADTEIPLSITLSNLADGAAGSIVNEDLYLQISGDSAGLNTGTLTNVDGTVTYPLTSVTGVDGIADGDYYIVPNTTLGSQVDVVYTPTVNAIGNLTVTADVVNIETGAAEMTSTNTEVLPIDIGNNGAAVTTAATVGNETPDSAITSLIELNNFTVGLVDNDGSEEFSSIMLGNVPQGFLVYVGADAASAAPANNAGGNGSVNTWVLSGQGEALPDYVGILPPQNWSGTVTGIEAMVISGETALSNSRTETFGVDPITINPVANGVVAAPTSTFGNEGEITTFNLNIGINDANDATVEAANPDQDQESATLVVTGMGAFASFYIGTTLITNDVSYDEGTDAYTIAGLSQTDLDTLGFRQASNAMTDQNGTQADIQIGFSATTMDGADVSAAQTTEVTVSLFDQAATGGDDTLLYTSLGLDGLGGEDTVDVRIDEDLTGAELAGTLVDIETLNLDIEGSNLIDGLTTNDVQSITDGDDALVLNGTPDDTVNLAGSWFDLGGGVYAADASGNTVTLTVTGGVQVGAPAGGFESSIVMSMMQSQQSTFGFSTMDAPETLGTSQANDADQPGFGDVMQQDQDGFGGLMSDADAPSAPSSQGSMVAGADLFPGPDGSAGDMDGNDGYEF